MATVRNLKGERLRRYRNVRYRRFLNDAGFNINNLLLQTGDQLVLQSDPNDVLKLQDQS